MEHMLLWIGRLAGATGVLACAVAAVARLSGHYLLGAIQVGTLLQAGLAGMTFGCLCLLAVLTNRRDPRL